MAVDIEGIAANGPLHANWQIIAKQGDGVNIPAIPTCIIARKLAHVLHLLWKLTSTGHIAAARGHASHGTDHSRRGSGNHKASAHSAIHDFYPALIFT